MPVGELAELAHRYGAEICVDAAQLAPHVPIDMDALGIDHLALSGHKLYAPFGVGVLDRARAGASPRPSRCCTAAGAVARVLDDRVVWCDAPARFEAGTPNVFGAIALGAACDALTAYGMPLLAAEELTLGALLRERLAAVPGVQLLEQWHGDDVPRVALASFHVPSIEAGEVARRLAEEHAISVRSGAFCAHPLVRHLRGVARASAPGGGAVRASLGIGSGIDDIEHAGRRARSADRHAPRAGTPQAFGRAGRGDVRRPAPRALACSYAVVAELRTLAVPGSCMLPGGRGHIRSTSGEVEGSGPMTPRQPAPRARCQSRRARWLGGCRALRGDGHAHHRPYPYRCRALRARRRRAAAVIAHDVART